LRHGRAQTLSDGQVAGRAGETTRTLTGLVQGNLVVWLPIADGSRRPLHVLRAGAWIASRPLIRHSGLPRRVDLVASGPVTVIRFEDDVVEDLVARHPVLWEWLLGVVGSHLDLTLDICSGLLAERPMPRIAARLLALTAEAGDGQQVAIDLKQSDLALLSGVSRNTVSRTLGELEAMGVISRGYRRLRVLDRAGLERVAAQTGPR